MGEFIRRTTPPQPDWEGKRGKEGKEGKETRPLLLLGGLGFFPFFPFYISQSGTKLLDATVLHPCAPDTSWPAWS